MENFPESYKIMVDEDKFWRFIKDLIDLIKRSNIKAEGVEVHRRGWEFIEVR